MGAGADHLKALARVARILRTEPVVDALRGAADAGKIYDILTRPLAAQAA
jgi:PTS system nitrogen regulatory IIA component